MAKPPQFILQTGHSYGKMKLLPHSTTVSRNIAILYQTQHVILKEELVSIKDNGFAITCDLWKNEFLKRTNIGATAQDESLSHKVLAMRGMDNLKNTGHNIRIKMENILILWMRAEPFGARRNRQRLKHEDGFFK
ncbi:uncharacterized protein [Musca autumnalis]|uniref:uncharacterized protein n=1 Tax=Musca autumnalis TaxID=221902 RepID=UPI003CF27B8C